ncbi:hypothetical protein L0Y65_01710 [Candidatus Micrarchaeota archaeon]|nr:hypothetical protein [Candidatus Micrarchaeota archaeon]
MPPAKRRASKARTSRRAAGSVQPGMIEELFSVKQELREAMGQLQNDGDVELVLALMQSRRSGKPGSRRKARD